MPFPSFNYRAINAPGGIAAGIGGITSALIDAQAQKRHMDMQQAQIEQAKLEREADREVAAQRYAGIAAHNAATEQAAKDALEYRKGQDTRTFDYKTNQDAAELKLKRDQLGLDGLKATGSGVYNFMKLMTGGHSASAPADRTVIPGSTAATTVASIYDRERAAIENRLSAEALARGDKILGPPVLSPEQEAALAANVQRRVDEQRRLTNELSGHVSRGTPTATAPKAATPDVDAMTDDQIKALKTSDYADRSDEDFVVAMRAKFGRKK